MITAHSARDDNGPNFFVLWSFTQVYLRELSEVLVSGFLGTNHCEEYVHMLNEDIKLFVISQPRMFG